MVTDITERHETREALNRSEARFSRLASLGMIGIASTDIDGNVLDANDEYLRILAYSRADLAAGLPGWKEVTPPEWREQDAVALARLRATGVAPPVEKELLRRDGTRVPVLVCVAHLDGPNCLAVIADLTSLRAAQEALHATEQHLRQAQKMETVGVLVGGIAHDFNNMLSVVLSYAEIALDALDPADPVRRHIERVQLAGLRAADLTRRLLAFGRRQVLHPARVDLGDIVETTMGMLRRLVPENVEIRVHAGAELGAVVIDPSQMGRVLANLVINARDAMPGGGRLDIETANFEVDAKLASSHVGLVPGPHVALRVTDTGTGMDAATRARVFEPFFTTKGPGLGTGLGLAVVFGFVKQSGGHIHVDSEVGRGTTFELLFPRAEAEGAPAPTPTPPVLPAQGTETILVVEDEEQVREAACSVLRRGGYIVLEAVDGADAERIEAEHTGPIHLLLTDMVMPALGGEELAARLSALRPAMMVVFTSGHSDAAVASHGMMVKGATFLPKPLTPGPLLEHIRSRFDAAPVTPLPRSR